MIGGHEAKKKPDPRLCASLRRVQNKCWISQTKTLFLIVSMFTLGLLFSRLTFTSKDAYATIYNNGVNNNSQIKYPKRPVMYTFFSRIDSDSKETGMDDTADNDQLAIWKAEWNSAGWDTEVLNLDHAKLHPRFQEFRNTLRKVPLEGVSGMNRAYNELCFLRWLAVAIMGGGWMSDYDVFPLPSENLTLKSQELPNGGKFTVYSMAEGGGGIPCLLSGSAEEWDRLADALLNNAIQHTDTVLWSDMFALMELRDQDINTHVGTSDVIPGQFVLIGKDWKDSDCNKITKDKIAVHFSHTALLLGDLSNIDRADRHPSYRPFVARSWLKMWKEICGVFPHSTNSQISHHAPH